jgi:hypothetical protein
LRPDNVELARHYHALATKAEDALERTVSADLVKRLDPKGAGKEVMDPVTLTTIVGIAAAALVTIYNMSSEARKAEIIRTLPKILEAVVVGAALL